VVLSTTVSAISMTRRRPELGGQDVGEDHGAGQVGGLLVSDLPALIAPPDHKSARVIRRIHCLTCSCHLHHGPFGSKFSRTILVCVLGEKSHPALAASCALTCAADGLHRAVPSGNSTVGTVWFPPLTDITNSAAAGSFSMSTSAISMPALFSWFFRFRQKPHQVVVYIVS
jgi:hypothetical protein